MKDEQVPLKIVIPVEEEVPFVPERQRGTTGMRAQEWGQKLFGAIRRGTSEAWNSRIRRRATSQLKKGTATLVTKGGQLVQEKLIESAGRQARESVTAVGKRVRSTKWKQETLSGAARGLRWTSRKLARLADKFTVVQDRSAEPPE